MKCFGVTIHMKATEQYFPVVLFTILYKLTLTSESVDEIQKCDYSNESYWAVLSRGNALAFGSADRILRTTDTPQ